MALLPPCPHQGLSPGHSASSVTVPAAPQTPRPFSGIEFRLSPPSSCCQQTPRPLPRPPSPTGFWGAGGGSQTPAKPRLPREAPPGPGMQERQVLLSSQLCPNYVRLGRKLQAKIHRLLFNDANDELRLKPIWQQGWVSDQPLLSAGHTRMPPCHRGATPPGEGRRCQGALRVGVRVLTLSQLTVPPQAPGGAHLSATWEGPDPWGGGTPAESRPLPRPPPPSLQPQLSGDARRSRPSPVPAGPSPPRPLGRPSPGAEPSWVPLKTSPAHGLPHL